MTNQIPRELLESAEETPVYTEYVGVKVTERTREELRAAAMDRSDAETGRVAESELVREALHEFLDEDEGHQEGGDHVDDCDCGADAE